MTFCTSYENLLVNIGGAAPSPYLLLNAIPLNGQSEDASPTISFLCVLAYPIIVFTRRNASQAGGS